MKREIIFSGSAGTGYGGRGYGSNDTGGHGGHGSNDTGGQGRVRGYGTERVRRRECFAQNAFSLFDALWDSEFPINDSPLLSFSGYSTPQFPPADIEFDRETKDMYFTFALAGYKPEEIDVKFEENYLVLSSEIITEKKDESKAFYKKGIKKTSFSVKYAVPVTKYNTEETEASFSDGLLKIKIPAKEEIKPKQIKIKTK